MKYASLAIFAAALIWTWTLIHSASPISFETHSGIQERLAEFIVETVKSKRPNASEILVEKIWTEVLGDGKVKAFFIYSFKDSSDEAGLVSSRIQGEGILERQGEDETGNDRWSLTQVQTTGDAIQFDEALIVTGSPEGTSDETSESLTESPASESPAPVDTETETQKEDNK